MHEEYKLKNYSQVQRFGTGFGVISLVNRNITFKHYNIKNDTEVDITDTFTLYSDKG